MKNRSIWLIGGLVGSLIVFFLPIFPVPIPHIAADSMKRIGTAIWWISGLSISYSPKLLLALEIFGACFGSAIFGSYVLIKGDNKK